MAHWINKLDISDAWAQADQHEDFRIVSREIVDKLEKLDFGEFNDDRNEIVMGFQDLIDDKSSTVDDFDLIMDDLYNFGDISLDGKFGGKKLLWINI
jgi:hypothetical protein